jgi:hypothetical protein
MVLQFHFIFDESDPGAEAHDEDSEEDEYEGPIPEEDEEEYEEYEETPYQLPDPLTQHDTSVDLFPDTQMRYQQVVGSAS